MSLDKGTKGFQNIRVWFLSSHGPLAPHSSKLKSRTTGYRGSLREWLLPIKCYSKVWVFQGEQKKENSKIVALRGGGGVGKWFSSLG